MIFFLIQIVALFVPEHILGIRDRVWMWWMMWAELALEALVYVAFLIILTKP